jgi:intracellular multiplication protein IcmE
MNNIDLNILSFIIKIGFDLLVLKLAGFTAQNLIQAGYGASDSLNTLLNMVDIGYTATNLRDAGFNIKDLYDAGFTINELSIAGFKLDEIASLYVHDLSIYSPSYLYSHNYSATDARRAGYSITSLIGIYSIDSIINAGFNIKELYDAGFYIGDILSFRNQNNGLPTLVYQLYSAGYNNISDFYNAGVALIDLKYCNISVTDLLDAGYPLLDVTAINYSIITSTIDALRSLDLLKASLLSSNRYSAAYILANSCLFTLVQLYNKGEGFSASDMKYIFNIFQLKEVGYSATQLQEAGYDVLQLQKAKFTDSQIIAAGYSATQLKALGYNATQLQKGGYVAIKLQEAGYIDSQIIAAGYSATQLIEAGYNANQLKALGYNANQLKTAGYTDSQIMGAGYTYYELYSVGYTNIYFQKVCAICINNSTTNNSVEYKPLKTMRHTDNISQKMKQAAFIRRTQNTSITQTDTINFRFKNL